ncbi:MAG: hypothetical protein Q4E13_10045 [Clostridia bacterium]|nr:hypothetical protein [Clostridia bacterium]
MQVPVKSRIAGDLSFSNLQTARGILECGVAWAGDRAGVQTALQAAVLSEETFPALSGWMNAVGGQYIRLYA